MIEIKVSKSFGLPVGTILDDFHISFKEGEIVALVGPSGCGKTTLLNLIAQVIYPDPEKPHALPLKLSVAYAFQTPKLIPWRNVLRNTSYESELLNSTAWSRDSAEELLKMVGLGYFGDIFPFQLSLGMQQRLQLARVLHRPSDLLLLDEPLGAVDRPLRLAIASHFRIHLKERGTSAIWVTHDSSEAITIADKVVVVGGKPLSIVYEHSVGQAAPKEKPRYSPSSVELEASAINEKLESIYVARSEKDITQVPGKSKATSQMWKSQLRTKTGNFAIGLVPLVLVLAAWQLVVVLMPRLRFFISEPTEWIPMILSELSKGGLFPYAILTLREMLIGLLIGLASGAFVGFVASLSTNFSRAVRPYLIGMTAVPLFVLAPAFILWFGVGIKMKIAIAAASCFPVVATYIHDAAVDAKDTYFAYLRSAGAKLGSLFRFLILPSSIKGGFNCLRFAAVAALIGAFLGEFIAASEGLGYYIIFQASRYRVAEVLVGVAVLFLVALCVDFVSRVLSKNSNKIISFLNL